MFLALVAGEEMKQVEYFCSSLVFFGLSLSKNNVILCSRLQSLEQTQQRCCTLSLGSLEHTLWKGVPLQRGPPYLTCECPGKHCNVLYFTSLKDAIKYSTVLYSTLRILHIPYCIEMYCIIMYCTALHCTELYCSVLCCLELNCCVQ